MQIALVEDDIDIARLIQAYLEHQGHHCEHFIDGHSFKKRAAGHDFDLYIFDWYLPDLTGDELIRWTRKHKAHHPAIIIVTSSDSRDNIITGLELGADDYMTKPIELDELRARIYAVLRRSETKTIESIQQIGSLKINPSERTVEHLDQTIRLTNKEFALAQYFFNNMGRVLSRKELLEKIWGINASISTRTIDTHISNLRNKLSLKEEHGWQLIAIYHHGYRLDLLDDGKHAIH